MDELDRELELHDAIREIIREEAAEEKPLIGSEDIYNILIERGIEPQPGAMAQYYEQLKREGLINGMTKHNREAAQKHGAFEINWVSPLL